MGTSRQAACPTLTRWHRMCFAQRRQNCCLIALSLRTRARNIVTAICMLDLSPLNGHYLFHTPKSVMRLVGANVTSV